MNRLTGDAHYRSVTFISDRGDGSALLCHCELARVNGIHMWFGIGAGLFVALLLTYGALSDWRVRRRGGRSRSGTDISQDRRLWRRRMRYLRFSRFGSSAAQLENGDIYRGPTLRFNRRGSLGPGMYSGETDAMADDFQDPGNLGS